MRDIDPSSRFKRDYKRKLGGIYRDIIAKPDGELWRVVDILADDMPLPAKYNDHPLHNNWEGFRECHIRPDLLLIYAYIDDDLLRLERLGTHAEIFGL